MVTIYRYFRSLAVDSPFTTARENLIVAFEKVMQPWVCSCRSTFISKIFETVII